MRIVIDITEKETKLKGENLGLNDLLYSIGVIEQVKLALLQKANTKTDIEAAEILGKSEEHEGKPKR